jgi:outer membrane scaffolding protein for murein synthesis (MipA/OmpV family)
VKKAYVALAAVIVWSPGALAESWTLDVGTAVTSLPDSPGSRHSTARALPLIDATYGNSLTLSLDDGLRWTALRAGPLKFGLVGEYRQHDRSIQAAGFPGMGDALEFGGFAQADTSIASFECRIRQAVTGYKGLSADISADTGGEVRPGTQLGLEVRAAWADYRFVQSRFGRGVGGRHDLDPRDPDGPHYVSAGLQLAGSQRLTSHLDMVGVLSEDRLLGYINSPLIETRELRQITVGLRYRFAG